MGIKELESPINKVASTVKKARPKELVKVSKEVQKAANKYVPNEIKKAVNKLPSPLSYAAVALPTYAAPYVLPLAANQLQNKVKAQYTALTTPPAPPEAPQVDIEMPEMPDYGAIFGEIGAAQKEAANALQNFDVPDLPAAAPSPPPLGQAAQNLNSWNYNALRRDQYRGAGSTVLGGSQGLGAGPSTKKTLLGG